MVVGLTDISTLVTLNCAVVFSVLWFSGVAVLMLEEVALGAVAAQVGLAPVVLRSAPAAQLYKMKSRRVILVMTFLDMVTPLMSMDRRERVP